MKKDNTLLIVLIILGVVFFIFASLGLGIFFVAKTVYNNAYKDLYCNDTCIKYDGKVIREYDDENSIFDDDEDIYTCDFETEECIEKIIEQNDKYLILNYEEDNYIYYKYPYKPKELENQIKNNLITNSFFTDGEHEIYIYDAEHVIIGGKNYSQIKGYIDATTIGYDRYYDISFGYPDSYYVSDNLDDIATNYIYDSQTNSIFGYKKGDIKDAKYINLDNYDQKGNLIIKEEDLNELYGKYNGKVKINDEDEISKVLSNEEVIEIKDKYMYFNIVETTRKESYEITDINKDTIYIETEDNSFIYDRNNKSLCKIEYDDDEDEFTVCFKKIS